MSIYFYIYFECKVRGLRSVNSGTECVRFAKGDKPFTLPSESHSGTRRGVNEVPTGRVVKRLNCYGDNGSYRDFNGCRSKEIKIVWWQRVL